MGHMSTRQYARLVREWVTGIGLQVFLAVMVLRVPLVRHAFEWIGDGGAKDLRAQAGESIPEASAPRRESARNAAKLRRLDHP